MKRIFFLILALLLLVGCGPKEDPHPEWDAAWTRVGQALAVEPPEGFTLNESNDMLAPSGIYYATWTKGEERTIENAEGESALAYDAQIYLLVQECRKEKQARENVALWIEREASSYTAEELGVRTAAGQEFRVLGLKNGAKANPYPRGAAAFAVRGNYAISVELVCAETFSEDPEKLLEQVLAGFHYGN